MTKKFEFDWKIEVPQPLLTGCVCDRWTEEKDNVDLEQNALFKVDENGFFIYWKSDGKVRFINSLVKTPKHQFRPRSTLSGLRRKSL